jgi:BirA family biotin operon repressor/biotin-[acetyl-CoA-carboxylase] ligase
MTDPDVHDEVARHPSSSLLTHWEGEPVQVWARLWGIPLLEAHDRLTSTNDRARSLLLGGAERFTTVIAEEQTAGRGRSGRRWDSPPGRGLWMSTLVSGAGHRASALTPILVGIALIRSIRAVVPGAEPGLKWPNDVYLGARKVGGVLCESVGDLGDGRHVIAGVGVNVRQTRDDFPLELRETANSLEMASGHPVSRRHLAGQVMAELKAILSDPPPQITGPLAAEIERVDVLAGQVVTVSTGIEGVAGGYGSDGSLKVRDRAGREHRIRTGSVSVTRAERPFGTLETETNGA